MAQEPSAGTAGSLAPAKQKPEDAVSYEDFTAEVIAAGLADDWDEEGLQHLFAARALVEHLEELGGDVTEAHVHARARELELVQLARPVAVVTSVPWPRP